MVFLYEQKSPLFAHGEFEAQRTLLSGQTDKVGRPIRLQYTQKVMRETEKQCAKSLGVFSPFFFGDGMNYRGLKAAKAFALGLVVSGLVVACNEASPVAKTIAPEAEAVASGASKNSHGTELTAAERETKKREFFAKPEVKEMSAGLEEIAEAVAVAVEDKELRECIYAKCMEKFDGETNVLWQQLEGDNNLRAKGGWNKRVDDLVGKGRKNTIVKGVGNVDAAIKKFEKIVNAPLHLFWMYPSQWDKKTTPLVAFVPFDMDPDNRQSIPAFDSKGNRFELDRKGELAKKRPVLVLTANERTNVNGTLRAVMAVVDGGHTQMAVGKNGTILQSNAGDFRIRVEQINIPASVRGYESEWEGQQEFFFSYIWWGSYGHTVGWLGKSTASAPSFSRSDEYDMVAPSVQFKYWEADGLWWDDWLDTHLINTDANDPDPTVPPLAAGLLEYGHPRYEVAVAPIPREAYTPVTTRYRLVPKN